MKVGGKLDVCEGYKGESGEFVITVMSAVLGMWRYLASKKMTPTHEGTKWVDKNQWELNRLTKFNGN